ncbi:MAG TPA: vitamin K epoxide reductase family protein [Bacteroidota bacterium]|nr:vitamin K epoxide reductase family protein [Bacteroidota bacterium]
MLTRWILGILSSLGFLISLYFSLVYHKLIPADARFIPKFCRMDQSSCESILATRDARVFGVPNFSLGLIFYLTMIIANALPELMEKAYLLLVAAAGFSVATSLFLSYSLLFRLKARCVLCFTSHVLNFLIFLLL